MKQEFEALAYDATCMAIGEAVWQLVASGETVSQEAIASMILKLSEWQPGIAESVTLSVLNDS